MNLRPGFWDYFLVLLQIILLAAYLFLPYYFSDVLREAMQFIGAAPMLLGGVIIIWAIIQQKGNISIFPTPPSGGRLITRGLYNYIRHPIYSGIILLAIGYGIYHSSFNHLVMALIIFLLFDIKATYEEQRLMMRFPEYWDYKVRTGKFFPIRINIKDVHRSEDRDVPLELEERDEESENEDQTSN